MTKPIPQATDSISNLQNTLTNAIEFCVPPRKPTTLRKRGVSLQTKQLIEERSKNYSKLNEAEIKASSKAISTASRNDYRSYMDDILKDMEKAETVGNTREITRLVKVIGGKTKQTSPMPSKGLDGEPITCSKTLLSEWNTFLSAKFAPHKIDKTAENETTVSPEDHLTDEELTACLKAMKDGKAPGADGLPIEAYKYSQTATEELFRIVRLIWDNEDIPQNIVKGIFIMLYKKKDRDDFGNYRAICLLCHCYKLLSAVISKRLGVELQSTLPDSQAGFRQARGTRDNICILKWTIDMLIKESKPAVITFIDYTAAFDTVSHSFLDKALSSAGASTKLRRVIQSIYSAASGCVRIRNPDGTEECSDTFDISRGVLQGDIFSPVAFIAGLMHIFKTHDNPNAGVTVGSFPNEVTITSLEYADDAGLVDVNIQEASTRISSIAKGSREDAAMTISIPKTKVMHVHKKARVSATTEEEIASLDFKHICPDCERDFPTKRGLSVHKGRWCDGGKTLRSRKGSLADKHVQTQKLKEIESNLGRVTIEGHQLDNVYTFEYLGCRVQCDGDERADVDHRMAIAQSIFNSLSHIWSDHRLSSNLKIRLYKAGVCSAFLHGCEAWSLSDRTKRSINGFNSRCLSSITGQDYRETATHPVFNLINAIIRRRLRFAGHILRMDHQRLLRRTFITYMSSLPRPPGSLLHGLESMPLDELTALANNRQEWSSKIDSLCI